MSCVPLRSVRPSLASSTSGARPARRSASPPGRRSPSSSASPSPISTSARCASGARSPDAPTEPRDGMSGWTPRVEHLAQQLDDRRRARPSGRARAPRRGGASSRAPRRSAAARRRRRRASGRGSAAARAISLGGDAHLGERAEPGVHAVDRGGARRRRRRCARSPRASGRCARVRPRRGAPAGARAPPGR